MKRFAYLIFALVLTACATTAQDGSKLPPMSQAIQAAYASYAALDTAINAADAAILAKTLKGKPALDAANAMVKAKAALDVTLAALQSAQAAADASAAASAPTGATK